MNAFFYKIVFFFLLLPVVVVHAGFQPYKLVLEPTAAIVHYNDGYIRAPGFIDLGGLKFTAISEPFLDEAIIEQDDVYGEDGDDGGPRFLDGGIETGGTAVDIAVFRLPQSCAHSKKGCDWPKLGVGNWTKDGSLRWCCSREAIEIGICSEKLNGRLMIDSEQFEGNHRYVTVPPEGPMMKQIRYGKMEENVSGTYVVLYANCQEEGGREVYVEGESVWKSKHGYLPGELFGFMLFYTVVTIVYFVLLVWYGVSMYVNEESRIEIEKWIFFAIVLGLLEMIFRTGDYYVWNSDGYRSDFIIWIGILTGVLKQGISRCLLVMVCLGWGVVRDSLGSTMRIIVVLGTVFIVISAIEDMLIVFAIEDVNELSKDEEEDIVDVAKILTIVLAVVDVIFVLWWLDGLNNTMMYLENMSQTRKLDRFLKLRCILLIAVLIATVRAVFALVDSVDEDGIIGEEHAWAVDAANELNYLVVLIGVAFLWRPNPNAKEYAYVMELPAMGVDGDELELSGVVPSAADSDEGSVGKNGFKDDGYDDNFEIS